MQFTRRSILKELFAAGVISSLPTTVVAFSEPQATITEQPVAPKPVAKPATMGYQGAVEVDCGFFYCPYVPLHD